MPRTRRAGASRRGSSTCRATPEMTLLVGRNGGAVGSRRRQVGLGGDRHRLARGHRPRRHRRHRHRDAGRLARRDRDRRPRGRQARAVREAAREHRRRGRGDGRRRRARRRAAASSRWSASPTAGFRRRRSPATSSPRAPSARSARCAPSTCRTGSSTRPRPLAWRLQKEHAGSGALGDIGAHAIDLAQFITGQRLTDVSGTIDTVVDRAPAARRGQRALGHRRHRARRGHRRRRRPVHRPLRRRRARHVRGDRACAPAARTRCASRSRARAARSRSTSRT